MIFVPLANMKYLLSILLLLPLGLLAQEPTMPVKDKGEVFKHSPTKPYEDLNKTGRVVVTKDMYGLNFKDKELKQIIKDKVKAFFAQNNSGYTELKEYTLKIEKKDDTWYIEGYKVEP